MLEEYAKKGEMVVGVLASNWWYVQSVFHIIFDHDNGLQCRQDLRGRQSPMIYNSDVTQVDSLSLFKQYMTESWDFCSENKMSMRFT